MKSDNRHCLDTDNYRYPTSQGNCRRKLLAVGIIFLMGYGIVLAQEPLFTAIVSSDNVLQNNVFEIQFELKNASGSDFQPPVFGDFKVVGGPSVGSSTMIINGQVSRSQSWSYSLVAPKTGTFTIGPANVIAGRRKLASRPITIKVMEANDIASSGIAAGEFGVMRLIAYVKEGDYYPGQQIVLEYKLLFTENVQTANTLSEDDYADFFVQNFNSFSKEATYETVNGVTFTSRIIKAIALFAHQSGMYQIDPLVLDVGINAPYPGNQGFFTMRRLHNIRVTSDPLAIKILPLPADASNEKYSGAVGEYSMTTLLSGSTDITTDGDFSVKITISGNGDSRRWDPPAIVTDGDFEIYDPRIIEDNLADTDGSVLHSRTIEYQLIPKQPGEYHIYIPFRFFNPYSRQYETIRSDTITLHVAQGQNTPRYARVDSLESYTQLPLKKINYVKTDDRFWFSIPHLFLFSILLTGTLFGLWVTYKRRKESVIPEAERMRSIASQNARYQLDLLNKSRHEMDDKTFFEKATEIYYRFLSEKFNIPPADLDMEKIRLHFRNSGIPEDISEKAITFFNQCLVVRYGGIPGQYTHEEMIHECTEVIDSLDKRVGHHI